MPVLLAAPALVGQDPDHGCATGTTTSRRWPRALRTVQRPSLRGEAAPRHQRLEREDLLRFFDLRHLRDGDTRKTRRPRDDRSRDNIGGARAPRC